MFSACPVHKAQFHQFFKLGNSITGFCNLLTEEEHDHSRIMLEREINRLSSGCEDKLVKTALF